jgi:hypothetical protein
MKRKISLVDLLLMLCVSSYGGGETDLQKLMRVEQEFRQIDSTIFLVEEIYALSLKDRNPIGNPPEKYQGEISNLNKRLKVWGKRYSAKPLTLGETVSRHIDSLMKYKPDFINETYDDRVSQLYHHTKRIFDFIIGGGNVFDENMVSIYYQFRNELRQIIELEEVKYEQSTAMEKMKYQLSAEIEKMEVELTQQINGTKTEISMLNEKVNSLRFLMSRKLDSLEKTTNNQQRDEMVSQLVTRKKWRYKARKLTKQNLDLIMTDSGNRKAARRNLKKLLR